MIQSIQKAFQILEYIAKNGNDVRVKDISMSLGIQSTTVHNLLKTLKELGYLQQNEISPRYSITSKIVELNPLNHRITLLKSKIKPLLSSMANRLDETFYFAIQKGLYFRYEYIVKPNEKIALNYRLSKEYEMFNTAVGKVFVSFSEDLQKEWVQNISTESDKFQFYYELEKIKKNRVSYDIENYQKGVSCIAIPIIESNRVLGVVALSGESEIYTLDRLQGIASKIITVLEENHL